MSLSVIKPGLVTTVQDQGRPGYQRFGIAVGGAVDAFAARVANLVVGNDDQAAVLEAALIGPELRVETDLLIAVCGADFRVTLDGVPVAFDRPVAVRAGGLLRFGSARTGARAWLAVAGGIAVPPVLGSRSTYVRARLGGHEGRPLVAGDRLPVGEPSAWARALLAQLLAKGPGAGAPWSVRPGTLGRVAGGARVRVVRGPEWENFGAFSQQTFFAATYSVTKDIDRMGMRLQGPALSLRQPRDEISSAVNVGVVQVPPSGQPIVLLAGRQSVGGYPRIAVVVRVDLGKLAQFKAGDPIQFEEITLRQAHELWLARERDFERVRSNLGRLAG